MAVNYRDQYRPDQLEPFFPNEFMKMSVSVLCTLAVIMAFAILPVALDMLGFHDVIHREEPADPTGGTPVGIKPEWYFLASYQYLRLMPTELLGVSGKTLGVVTQGVAMTVLALLPFWYRRRANRRPGPAWRIGVTAVLAVVLALTVWGGWPERITEHGEEMMPFGDYVRSHPMLFVVIGIAMIAFFGLVAHERRRIRNVLDAPPPEDQP